MNEQTEKLGEQIAEGIFERGLPSLVEFWGTLEQIPAMYLDAFWQDALDEAVQILKDCKEAGLTWYDGKRDKFKEIE